MIIAFEGVDKAGKGTQSALLRDMLANEHGLSAALFDFPTKGTPTGDAVSAYISGGRRSPDTARVMPCLAAADFWAAAPRVESALRTHDVLVLNRSPASNLAYGRAAGLDGAWLHGLTGGHPACGRPAATILLDIPVSESFRRHPENRDTFESDRAFLQDARAAYLSEARRHGWVVVRADRPAGDVHRTVLRRVMPLVRRARRQGGGGAA